MEAATHTPGRSPYPRYFCTPEGRPVSIRQMGSALRAIRQRPDAEYLGWNWFPTPGRYIVAEFRRGLNERINARAALQSTGGEHG